ncbi:efflux RND transporter permease subunit [Ideonella livida]|uniref:Efflux RND transporter permease subunit n=1 Tax=Ideonella livida TaxID=2707176 RepID=A0A7C9TGR4_9BURK|nr:efflux RND transporter permease subunit [Ideonella livida]NDY89979.1 efflux RND transporter permease subunit [Ideonella livida]
MWFTRVSIANPVMAVMVMLALMVLGTVSYLRLKVDQFPNIEFPTVVVTTAYPGAAAEIVEQEVTRRVEESVNTIAGVNQLTSRTYEGQSVVIIQFNLDLDPRRVADDVREKVSQVRAQFPQEVEEPKVQRFDPASRPIWTLAVTSPGDQLSPMALSHHADEVLKKRLENVRGVGSVTLVGTARREINVYLRPQALDALGVSAEQVRAALAGDTRQLPAGTLHGRQTDHIVQVDGRMRQAAALGELVVARRNGQPVRLAQLAEVVDGPEEPESVALLNGVRMIALDVVKAQGENTLEVVDGLNRAAAELQTALPPGMALEVVRDNSRPIRVSVTNVRRTLVEGALLTVGIVFLFLNSWRSTVITGLTLPISLVGTFLFMQWFGFSINMITLMALSLCVGLLIDDAIVVRENIVRHVQMGKSPRQAALEGTAEIGLAVLATTLSIVAVFLPIGFMAGIIGKFFHEFGITIVAAVVISMFVSFTLDPMLSAVWHDPAIDREGQPFHPRGLYDRTLGRLTHGMDQLSRALGRGYQRALAWSLRHRGATLALAALTLVLSVAGAGRLGTEFVPKADFSETSLSFHTPVGTSLAVTQERARQVDALLRRLPEVRFTVATVNTGQALGRHQVGFFIRLVDRHERQRSVDELSAELRAQLAQVPGITVTHVGLLDAVGGAKPISVSIQGPDLAQLRVLGERLQSALAAVPGVADLDTSMKPDKPAVQVEVRRALASELGLSVGAITTQLRQLIGGVTLQPWQGPDGQYHDLKLRLAPDSRTDPATLASLPLLSAPQADGQARTVRLGQVAELREQGLSNQIHHRDLMREVELTANTAGRPLGQVSADIRAVLAAQPLPEGYRYRFGGSSKDMAESFSYAAQALVLGIVFIYMILASQFRSYLQPVALMSSLPLTLIGVVGALLVWRSTLNLFSVIGVVMLMGLVTKNAILLLDFAIRQRAQGVPRTEALMQAAAVRLRPILMTTLAMVFGMVPLAFALTEGSEQRAPMGQAVIGGVITSSVLTLVVVPVAYALLDDLKDWTLRRLGRLSPATGEAS